MLNRATWRKPEYLVVGVTLGVLVIVVLYVMILLLLKWQQYDAQIDDIEPRYARLAGLVQSESQLRALEREGRESLDSLVYGATENTNSVATKLQQQARNIFSVAGLDVSASQISRSKQRDGFVQINIALNADGSLDALAQALAELEQARPKIFVSKITVQPKRRRNTNEPQLVEVRAQLRSLQAGGQGAQDQSY
ncbi:type II secretion system protein GspM [Gilvimarinus agarilyticus]|uniref:type II secretion system protein GspM n=1 Tax=Gilvimarinus agarilyticus TaxID=679259 RepID=UPI0005A0E44F|nr:type II secretion system protein GspM [Gilvimarinus agarilyticus]